MATAGLGKVERLLTAVTLFLVGGFIADGGLAALSWRGGVLGLVLFLLIRPAVAWAVQIGGKAAGKERAAIAFFGIRGVGSFFYLAYALGEAEFAAPACELWATVTFAVLLSVLLHGVAATPVTARLDRYAPDGPARKDKASMNRSPRDVPDSGCTAFAGFLVLGQDSRRWFRG
ncbi:cation:proton antiporter [Streptomyces sp. ISL-66]|uniref:cation:proton antiporter n=1 Tax=Streptomyces sp. ISL-66 TaxID=2819186 RepID=UPI001BEA5ABB|nr:cation:proton antiporter [Streptomyces sp. ISL-66]MBT2468980.1 cation:proton antiporter [Streptomyces sp. ISL-66]